tara:strand:+ start:83 stop:253 length:171 start_codon:yes stop_codon:yes gene_type:complete
MVIRLKNDIDYCDCLDWQGKTSHFKTVQMENWPEFQIKFHTVGVTLPEREAYYIKV